MIEALITSKTRIRLLVKFFLNPTMSAYLRELSEEFGESSNGIRVELNRMANAESWKRRPRAKPFCTGPKNRIRCTRKSAVWWPNTWDWIKSWTVSWPTWANWRRPTSRVTMPRGKDTGIVDLVSGWRHRQNVSSDVDRKSRNHHPPQNPFLGAHRARGARVGRQVRHGAHLEIVTPFLKSDAKDRSERTCTVD